MRIKYKNISLFYYKIICNFNKLWYYVFIGEVQQICLVVGDLKAFNSEIFVRCHNNFLKSNFKKNKGKNVITRDKHD